MNGVGGGELHQADSQDREIIMEGRTDKENHLPEYWCSVATGGSWWKCFCEAMADKKEWRQAKGTAEMAPCLAWFINIVRLLYVIQSKELLSFNYDRYFSPTACILVIFCYKLYILAIRKYKNRIFSCGLCVLSALPKYFILVIVSQVNHETQSSLDKITDI